MAAPLVIPSVRASAVGALAAAAGQSVPAAAVAPSSNTGRLSAARAFPISAQARGLLVGPAQASVSYDRAFEGIAGATARVRADLEQTYGQIRRQGQGWYRLSLASAAVGCGLIAVAVWALLLNQITTGLLTTVSSVVPNAIASLLFVQARRADTRLDAVTKELTESREIYALLEITNTINDSHLQNELKAEIVRKVLAKSQGPSAVGAA